jgi:hypothetical protein
MAAVTGPSSRPGGLGSARPGPAHRPRPGQPWGMAAGPTTPAWVADNGTDKATIYPGFVHGSPISKAPLVVTLPGRRPHRAGLQPHPGVRGRARPVVRGCSCSPPRPGWSPAGTRGCPRPRPRPRSALGSPRPASRGWPSPPPRPAASCTQPTSTTAASTSSTRAWTGSGCRVGSATPGALAAMGRSTSGSWVGGGSWPRPGRTPTARTRSPARAGAWSMSTVPAAACWIGWSAGVGCTPPWGLVWAPGGGFGRFSGALLVGGLWRWPHQRYDPGTGAFRGRLGHEDGHPIQIQGLWGWALATGSPAMRPPGCSPPASTTRPTACSAPSRQPANLAPVEHPVRCRRGDSGTGPRSGSDTGAGRSAIDVPDRYRSWWPLATCVGLMPARPWQCLVPEGAPRRVPLPVGSAGGYGVGSA